jgi:hypothetical protein
MTSSKKYRIALVLLLVVCCIPFAAMLAGCGNDSKPPQDPGYYTGPLDKKGKKTEGSTDPNTAKGGAKVE